MNLNELVNITRLEFYGMGGTIVLLIGIIVVAGYFLLKNQLASVLYFNGIFGKITALFIYENRRVQAISLKRTVAGWHDQKDKGVFVSNAKAALLPSGGGLLFLIREILAETIDTTNIKFKELANPGGKLHFRKHEEARSIRLKGFILDILGIPIEAGSINVNPIRIQSLIAKFVDVAVKKVNDYWVKRFQGGMAPGGGAGGMIIGIIIGGVIGLMVGLMMGGGQMPSIGGFLPPLG